MINQNDTGLKHPIWEVCHGGMIGLRYLVAVRKDLLLKNDSLIDGVVDAVTRGLAHHDDDVKSVSAATLVPIASELTSLRPQKLGSLISVVWDCLLDMQDDLSASTGAVMDLLANLCSFPQVLEAMRENAREDPDQTFDQLVPRLYHFFRHTITSVRLAVLKALATFLDIARDGANDWVDWRLTRLLFQNMLLERNEGVLKKSYNVWQSLIALVVSGSVPKFATALDAHIAMMVTATVQPIGQRRTPLAMDTTLLIKPSGSAMTAVATKRSQKQDSDQHTKKKRKMEDETPQHRETHNTDGHMLHGEVELVGEEVMLRTRIYCSKALGLLLPFQPTSTLETSWSFLLPLLQSNNSSTRLFAAMLLEEIARHQGSQPGITAVAVPQLQALIDAENAPWYTDIVSSLQAARGQCQTLLSAFQNNAIVPRSKLPAVAVVCQGEPGAGPSAFSLADAEAIISHRIRTSHQESVPSPASCRSGIFKRGSDQRE